MYDKITPLCLYHVDVHLHLSLIQCCTVNAFYFQPYEFESRLALMVFKYSNTFYLLTADILMCPTLTVYIFMYPKDSFY